MLSSWDPFFVSQKVAHQSVDENKEVRDNLRDGNEGFKDLESYAESRMRRIISKYDRIDHSGAYIRNQETKLYQNQALVEF